MRFNVVISGLREFLRDNLEASASTTAKQYRHLRALTRGHVRALDGLRGVAILLVLFYHFTGSYIHAFSGVLYQFSALGWCGVDLFFVLSGFLITGILCDAKDDQHYFRKFYMRRVLRIFPLYYGFLFVLFVILPLEHQLSASAQRDAREQIWLWSYLTNFDYILSPHRLLTKLHLAHFWSLAVEEQFYLIWPAVIFCCRPKTAIRISAICIGVALVLRLLLMADHFSPVAIFNFTFCRMDSLAVGALCALLIRTDVSADSLLKIARVTAIISGVGLLCILSTHGEADVNNPVMQSVGYSLLAFFFGGILLLSLDPSKRNVLSWLLGCPILVAFGFYSYAIYVFHFPLIGIFDRWFPVNKLSLELHSKVLGLEVHAVLSILASLVVALLSWNLYEKHFLKLKKYFVLSTKSTAPSKGHTKMNGPSFFSRPRNVAHDFGLWLNQRPFLKKSGLSGV
jgi:peptidoglycan/LPS O-acetylase OafA/YrhL